MIITLLALLRFTSSITLTYYNLVACGTSRGECCILIRFQPEGRQLNTDCVLMLKDCVTRLLELLEIAPTPPLAERNNNYAHGHRLQTYIPSPSHRHYTCLKFDLQYDHGGGPAAMTRMLHAWDLNTLQENGGS